MSDLTAGLRAEADNIARVARECERARIVRFLRLLADNAADEDKLLARSDALHDAADTVESLA